MNKPREFIIHTGMAGMKAFDQSFKVLVWETHLHDLFKKKLITEEERDNIQKMLHSPDPETVTFALIILETKDPNQAKDGSNIYSRRSQIRKRKS